MRPSPLFLWAMAVHFRGTWLISIQHIPWATIQVESVYRFESAIASGLEEPSLMGDGNLVKSLQYNVITESMETTSSWRAGGGFVVGS